MLRSGVRFPSLKSPTILQFNASDQETCNLAAAFSAQVTARPTAGRTGTSAATMLPRQQHLMWLSTISIDRLTVSHTEGYQKPFAKKDLPGTCLVRHLHTQDLRIFRRRNRFSPLVRLGLTLVPHPSRPSDSRSPAKGIPRYNFTELLLHASPIR